MHTDPFYFDFKVEFGGSFEIIKDMFFIVIVVIISLVLGFFIENKIFRGINVVVLVFASCVLGVAVGARAQKISDANLTSSRILDVVRIIEKKSQKSSAGEFSSFLKTLEEQLPKAFLDDRELVRFLNEADSESRFDNNAKDKAVHQP